jgi:hypothetical protein
MTDISEHIPITRFWFLQHPLQPPPPPTNKPSLENCFSRKLLGIFASAKKTVITISSEKKIIEISLAKKHHHHHHPPTSI